MKCPICNNEMERNKFYDQRHTCPTDACPIIGVERNGKGDAHVGWMIPSKSLDIFENSRYKLLPGWLWCGEPEEEA